LSLELVKLQLALTWTLMCRTICDYEVHFGKVVVIQAGLADIRPASQGGKIKGHSCSKQGMSRGTEIYKPWAKFRIQVS